MATIVEMTIRFKLDDVFGDPNDPDELWYIEDIVLGEDQLAIFSQEIGDVIAEPGAIKVLKMEMKEGEMQQ